MSSNLVIATGEHVSLQESATVTFAPLNASQVAMAFNQAPVATGCSLTPGSIGLGFAESFLYSPGPPLNLGSMTLTNGRRSFPFISSPPGLGFVLNPVSVLATFSAVLPAATDAPLGSLPPPSLPAGQWTWLTTGADAPQASLTFVVPESIHLAGSVPRTLIRTQDETITWNGAAFDSKTQLSLTIAGPSQILLTLLRSRQRRFSGNPESPARPTRSGQRHTHSEGCGHFAR